MQQRSGVCIFSGTGEAEIFGLPTSPSEAFLIVVLFDFRCIILYLKPFPEDYHFKSNSPRLFITYPLLTVSSTYCLNLSLLFFTSANEDPLGDREDNAIADSPQRH